MPVVKVELHSHTWDDPEDLIGHSPVELAMRAVGLGYGALAITLHDRYFGDPDTVAEAASAGLTLIPAVERTLEGRHVLLINFPEESARAATFADVADLKRAHPQGLVVAPHPFYPLGKSLGGRLLDRHASLWDAIEVNAFYTRGLDFNARAWTWARDRQIPLVGNGDIHQLEQLDTTYSLVDVEGPVDPDSICAAIRAGRVRVESMPLTRRAAFRIARRALLARVSRRRGSVGDHLRARSA